MGVLRGKPDWASSQSREFIGAAGSDLELASRFNPVMSQVPLGEVFFYDGFEAPVLHWLETTNSADLGVDLVTRYANTGAQSVQLLTTTSGDDYAAIGRQYTNPVGGRVGAGAFFSTQAGNGYWELDLRAFRDGRDVLFRSRVVCSTGAVQIDTGGGYVTIGTSPLFGQPEHTFQWWQLAGDFDTHTFVRIVIGATTIELGQAATWNVVYAGQDAVEISIYRRAIGATLSEGWIDDVILTRNEQ